MLRLVLYALLAVAPFFKLYASSNKNESTPRNGDVIFQSSNSNQSLAIMWATKSLYSHVGIVENAKDGVYVVEAIGKVSRTPLNAWIARGKLGRFALYRPKNLTAAQNDMAVKNAKALIGRPYDRFFHFDSERIYCSELVYRAFLPLGVEIGEKEKVGDLDVDNKIVRKLFDRRWREHPVCSKLKTENECWKKVMEDVLVTPESQSKDSDLSLVTSNYPL